MNTNSIFDCDNIAKLMNQAITYKHATIGFSIQKLPYVFFILGIILNTTFVYLLQQQTDTPAILEWSNSTSQSYSDYFQLYNKYPLDKQPTVPVAILSKDHTNLMSASAFDKIRSIDNHITTVLEQKGKSFTDFCWQVPTLQPDNSVTQDCQTAPSPLDYFKLREVVNGVQQTSIDIRMCLNDFSASCANKDFIPVTDEDIVAVVQSGRNQWDTLDVQNPSEIFYETKPMNLEWSDSKSSWDIEEGLKFKWEQILDSSRCTPEECYEFQKMIWEQVSSIESVQFDFASYSQEEVDQVTRVEKASSTTTILLSIALMVLIGVPLVLRFSPVNLRLLLYTVGVSAGILAYQSSRCLALMLNFPSTQHSDSIMFIVVAVHMHLFLVFMSGMDEAKEEHEGSAKKQVEYCFANALKLTTFTACIIILALLGGLNSKFPALRSICIHTSLGVAFVIINMLFLVAPVVAQDIGRQLREENDCFDCFWIGCGNICCPKLASHKITKIQGSVDNFEEDYEALKTGGSLCCQNKFNQESHQNIFVRIISEYLFEFLKGFKFQVIAFFIVLIVGAAILATRVERQFNFSSNLPTQLKIIKDYQNYNEEFPNIDRKYFILTGDFHTQDHQNSFIKFENILEEQNINNKEFHSFQSVFRSFVEDSSDNKQGCYISGVKQDLSNVFLENYPIKMIPETIYQTCLTQFLQTPLGQIFNKDLTIQSGVITYALIQINLKRFDDNNQQLQLMEDFAKISTMGPAGITPFQDNYLTVENLNYIYKDSFNVIWISLLILLGLALIILSSIGATLQLVFIVIAAQIEMFACIQVYGDQFNQETLPFLILSQVITIQYSATIIMKQLNVKGELEDRTFGTLFYLGPNAVISAKITSIALLFCFINPTPQILYHIKQILVSVVIALINSLVMLPTMLLVWGPPSTSKPAWDSSLQVEEVIEEEVVEAQSQDQGLLDKEEGEEDEKEEANEPNQGDEINLNNEEIENNEESQV